MAVLNGDVWSGGLIIFFISTVCISGYRELSPLIITLLQHFPTYLVHCPKSNPNFRDITLCKCSGIHDATWTIPRSITFSPLHFMLQYIAESGFHLGQRIKNKYFPSNSPVIKTEISTIFVRKTLQILYYMASFKRNKGMSPKPTTGASNHFKHSLTIDQHTVAFFGSRHCTFLRWCKEQAW